MDTTIRNLDETTYRELKARAARVGRTIGELVNDAIRAYLAPRSYPAPGERPRLEVYEIEESNAKAGRNRMQVYLSDESLARLEDQAAGRGESGLSELITMAVEFYLNHRPDEEAQIAEAIAAIGSLKDDEAERLRESVRRLRGTWR